MPRKAGTKLSSRRKRHEAGHGFTWRLVVRDPIEAYDEYTDETVELTPGQRDPGSIEGLIIDFRYYSRDGEVTRRSLLCWQCGRAGDRIYVRGYCPFREELRTFRVDRMGDVIAMMPEKEMPVDDALSFFAAFAADVAEEEQYLSLAASER